MGSNHPSHGLLLPSTRWLPFRYSNACRNSVVRNTGHTFSRVWELGRMFPGINSFACRYVEIFYFLLSNVQSQQVNKFCMQFLHKETDYCVVSHCKLFHRYPNSLKHPQGLKGPCLLQRGFHSPHFHSIHFLLYSGRWLRQGFGLRLFEQSAEQQHGELLRLTGHEQLVPAGPLLQPHRLSLRHCCACSIPTHSLSPQGAHQAAEDDLPLQVWRVWHPGRAVH